MRRKRKTTESFILECKNKHNNFYDYSNTEYKGCYETVKIICPLHGEFEQKAYMHINGQGCKQCGHMKSTLKSFSNTKDFIEKAKIKHCDFYQYDKVDYKNAKEFVIITCPIHGDFEQRPNYHLSGNGCTKCYNDNNSFGKSKFLHSCRRTGLGRLYVIKCYKEEEEFIKIGITSQTIKERFKRTDRFPYNYEIIHQEEGEAEFIYNLEKHYHRIFKNYRYQPKILFKGSSECFSITLKDYDFRRNEKSTR